MSNSKKSFVGKVGTGAVNVGSGVAQIGLRSFKFSVLSTVGLGGALLSTVSNLTAAGCNLAVNRLSGDKDSTFKKELEKRHDMSDVINKVLDGRYKLEEVYETLAPEDFRIVVDELKRNLVKSDFDFDINSAK